MHAIQEKTTKRTSQKVCNVLKQFSVSIAEAIVQAGKGLAAWLKKSEENEALNIAAAGEADGGHTWTSFASHQPNRLSRERCKEEHIICLNFERTLSNSP